MGRNIKETAEWFKHDFDMRNDDKILAVRRKFKHEGYSIWNMLLEKLTDSKNFELFYDDLNIELWSGDFDIEPEKLKQIIDYFIVLKLIQLENNNIFSSQLKIRFDPLYRKREYDRERLSSTKKNDNTDNRNESTQSRVEKSRVDINTRSDLDIFDGFRKLYGGIKKGNETEFKNFQKKHKDWKEVLPQLEPIIKKQIEHRRRKELKKEFVPEWKHLQTWINQRCWEEELSLPDGISPDGRFNPNGNGYAIDPQAYIHGTPPKGKYVGKPKIDQ